MARIKILHASDFHLDASYEGLNAGKAAVRRNEQRDLLAMIARITIAENADLVLLSGDIFDSVNPSSETGDILFKALSYIPVPVFISPGEHDFFTPQSPYAKLKLPENVHIFTDPTITYVDIPDISVRVYGAAFTGERSKSLLTGFCAERTDGVLNLLCMHGDVGVPASLYNPISIEDLEHSNLDYAAFGHNHEPSGLKKAGKTYYSWPGCPEGRGFNESGSRYISIVELDKQSCSLSQVETSFRRYITLKVDVTNTEPLLAIHSALPDETEKDIYRIILTGQTEHAPNIVKLQRNLDEVFFSLQLIDETGIPDRVWENCSADTLRGLFLSKMKERYDAASEKDRCIIEKAVRWGLAALENGEEVSFCEN